MLTYLDHQLTKHLADYDVALDWNPSNHTIEVIVRLFAENKEQTAIDDVDGTLSTEAVIEFEDGILFYHPQKSQVTAADFLALIPYEGKKGVSKACLDSFVFYLRQVLEEGQADLLDFLEDEQAEVFELSWSAAEFEQLVAQAPLTDQTAYLPYPSY